VLNSRIWDNHNNARIICYKIIMAARKQHMNKIQASSFHTNNYAAMPLYILERPSSWSTSRIRPLCPRSRVWPNLLLDLFPQVYSFLLWPIQYLAVCSSSSHFTIDTFLACWWPNTCTQVNSTLVLHHIHWTSIFTSQRYYSFSFFTLLPPLLAGRLSSSLRLGHTYALVLFQIMLTEKGIWAASIMADSLKCMKSDDKLSLWSHGMLTDF
jgi:hypothetical protein